MLENKVENFPNYDLERLRSIRHELHANPELGFEEYDAARLVMQELDRLGVEYVSGIAGTGVVATIDGRLAGQGKRVGLRADMDALPMEEASCVPYISRHAGKMHACGHDGHTAILLGVAARLSEKRDFSGTVHLIFQPAEEGLGGGQAMVREGLFERFPVDEVFALHNWPELPLGQVGICEGPIMAATDKVRIRVRGKGGHGGVNPHHSTDPVRISGALIQAIHSIVSRDVDPLEAGVISLCGIQGGSLDGFAIIPDEVNISGTVRSLEEGTRDTLENAMRCICHGIGETYGGEVLLDYERLFPVTWNTPASAKRVENSVISLWGEGRLSSIKPSMGAEDFSFMLKECPGAYLFLGTGREVDNYSLHSALYDFNDDAISLGVDLMVKIAIDSLFEL